MSLAVDEFRNGVKIGEIRRDMQIIVLGSSNSPRLFNFTSNIAPVQNRQITVNSNTTLHLAVSVIDPVDNDLISINAAGRAFLLNNPPVFTTYPVTSGYTNADLTWTPTNNEASNTPYVTSFRIGENHAGVTFYRDETFLLAVNRSVGIEDVLNNNNSVWGFNQGMIIGDIKMNSTAEVSICLYNITGSKVAEIHNGTLQAGSHRFALDAQQFPQDIYLVNIQVNNQPIPAHKIVISR